MEYLDSSWFMYVVYDIEIGWIFEIGMGCYGVQKVFRSSAFSFMHMKINFINK